MQLKKSKMAENRAIENRAIPRHILVPVLPQRGVIVCFVNYLYPS